MYLFARSEDIWEGGVKDDAKFFSSMYNSGVRLVHSLTRHDYFTRIGGEIVQKEEDNALMTRRISWC